MSRAFPRVRALFSRAAVALSALLLAGGALGSPLAAQQTHLLLVVGLSGEPQYKERFQTWASEIREAAVARLGIPAANVIWLGEDPSLAPGKMKDRASVATVKAAVSDIAARAGANDRVVVVMIGHGTESNGKALFNLVGPDLSPADLDLMLDELAPRRVAVVNAASASGSFVGPLAGPGRTVITATRNGREANETWFGEYFAKALAEEGADTDKDGRISLLEAFQYAKLETARYFTDKQLLATEHALLEDDGDGQGTMEPGPNTKDGALAGAFFVGGNAAEVAAQNAAAGDPVLRRLLKERAELEEKVADLRGRKGSLPDAEYEKQLETLLTDLALKSREIREHGGADK